MSEIDTVSEKCYNHSRVMRRLNYLSRGFIYSQALFIRETNHSILKCKKVCSELWLWCIKLFIFNYISAYQIYFVAFFYGFYFVGNVDKMKKIVTQVFLKNDDCKLKKMKIVLLKLMFTDIFPNPCKPDRGNQGERICLPVVRCSSVHLSICAQQHVVYVLGTVSNPVPPGKSNFC